MEQKEYFESWVAYRNNTDAKENWVEQFNTRKQATSYINEHFSKGKVMCCLSVDANLSGNEYGYGENKSEALKNLKEQLKNYGYTPYNPYTD